MRRRFDGARRTQCDRFGGNMNAGGNVGCGCGGRGSCSAGGDRRPNTCGEMRGCSLAMVYSPFQSFEDIYGAAEGLSRGTIFKMLDKPLVGNGRCGI